MKIAVEYGLFRIFYLAFWKNNSQRNTLTRTSEISNILLKNEQK